MPLPPSQTAWNNAFNDADGDGVAYKFAFVRALFGNSSAADTQFYTNISRATTAGLLGRVVSLRYARYHRRRQ